MGYVDLHSHILPGLDDGSPDDDTSLSMIQGLTALGFETLCATPHQKDGQFMPSAQAIGTAHARTLAAVRDAGMEVEIIRGAENMWDSVFFDRVQSDSVPGYGESAAFLLEFRPHELPLGLLDRVFQMRARGLLPVIAHPERYQPLWKAPEMARRLAEHCAMVVDLGAVAGYHGRKQKHAARSLLMTGLAHAAATDAHELADLRAAEQGMGWIAKKLGAAALARLLDDAPRTILEGRYPG